MQNHTRRQETAVCDSRKKKWEIAMMILTLGEIIEELSKERYLLLEQNTQDGSAIGSGIIILATSEEAEETMELAHMVYDGEINLKRIDFCKVEPQQECLAGTLRIPRLSEISASKFKLQFFVNKRNLVLIDDGDFAAKMVLRIQAKRTKQGQTRERFLYNFMTGLISRDLEFLGRYERQIMQLEDEVTNGKFDNYLNQVATIRKDLLILREYYDEMRDLGKELEEDENRFFSKKYLKYFGTLADRADRLMNRAMHLLDYIGQVRDTYQQKVSEQQNKNMQFLTVVSAIFFPLTLITGWYGMNFQNMPELSNGYPFVIVLSLFVVGIIIFIFKKKDIL